jgi:dihydropteroate synthase
VFPVEGPAAALRQLDALLDSETAAKIYLQPICLQPKGLAPAGTVAAGNCLLAGGPLAFSAVRVRARQSLRNAHSFDLPLPAALEWARTRASRGDGEPQGVLDRLMAPRPALAGIALNQARLMGVLNVTPDSFSDGGDFAKTASALERGEIMRAEGADIIDVGGESTRPGATPVTYEVERERVLGVVEGLSRDGAIVSIDTRRPQVMVDAVAAGAQLINDVSALTADPASLSTAAKLKAPVVLMHMQKTPETMQAAPHYDDALLDIYDALAARVAAAQAAGIPRDRLVVDPGIGFGKTVAHNLELLRGLALLHGLGCPVVVGVSRKSFLGRLTGGRLTGTETPKDRLPESLAAGLWALGQGAHILRVHDVAATRRAIAVWSQIGGIRPIP